MWHITCLINVWKCDPNIHFMPMGTLWVPASNFLPDQVRPGRLPRVNKSMQLGKIFFPRKDLKPSIVGRHQTIFFMEMKPPGPRVGWHHPSTIIIIPQQRVIARRKPRDRILFSKLIASSYTPLARMDPWPTSIIGSILNSASGYMEFSAVLIYYNHKW